MRTWIGGQENLRPGDTITNWSTTTVGGFTLEVQRLDDETVQGIVQWLDENGNKDAAKAVFDEFGTSHES